MIRPFRVFVPLASIVVFTVEALLISVCFTAGIFVISWFPSSSIDATDFLLAENGLARIAVALVSILLAMHFQGLHGEVIVRSRLWLFQQLCFVLGVAMIVQAVLASLVPIIRVPIRFMLGGGALSMCALFAFRLFYSARVAWIARWERLLFVGASPLFDELVQYIERDGETGLFVIGQVGVAAPGGCSDLKQLGSADRLVEIVQTTRPRRIVVGDVGGVGVALHSQLLALRFAGYRVEEAETVYERIRGQVRLASLGPDLLLYSRRFALQPPQLLFQWMWTAVVSLAAIAMLSPLLLFAAVMARIAFAGPILERHPRVGLGGKVFQMCRFRSATTSQPRIRWMARALAGVRDLPLLFNMLRGELALVGPAPEPPEFVDVLSREIPFYRHRHNVRPGLTGWARIHRDRCAPGSDVLCRLERDLYYVKNSSLQLDTFILLQTVKMLVLDVVGVAPLPADAATRR